MSEPTKRIGDHREERAYLAGEEDLIGRPTKRIVMDMSSEECQLETTYEDLSSVELGMTAKGEPQIKSVKVYAATAQEAGEKAMVCLWALKDALREEASYDPSS